MGEKARIFIGWDSRMPEVSDVLAYSLRKHSSIPLSIYFLKLSELDFRRPHDPLASTEFTYSRFLVPYLCGYDGVALFLDNDMICLGDIAEVLSLDMRPYALRVVKHDYRPSAQVKMDGRVQTSYPRKNWSSMMLLRCDRLRCWTKEAVETQSGAWLHRFEPIPDAEIGEIDGGAWNVLDRYDHATKLTHLTSGGPWFRGCEDHPCSDIWLRHRAEMESGKSAR